MALGVAPATVVGALLILTGLAILVRQQRQRRPVKIGPAATAAVVAPWALVESRPPVDPVPPPVAAPSLRATLHCGADRLTVRLRGARKAGLAWTWLVPGDRPPVTCAGVILGRDGDRRLWIDVALVPDVLTIAGDPAAGRRVVIALVEQLCNTGAAVTIVGDALGSWLPDGCAWVAAADAPASGADVLVCAELPDRSLTEILGRAAGRAVPVVLGDLPPSRWSVRVT
jgi:hypothetical protein